MTEPVGFAGGSDKPKDKKKRRPRLKPRQAKFVKGVIEGKSQRQAARDAGFPEGMAKNPQKIMTPRVEEAMRFELEKVGITDEILAQKIAEGIEATRVQVATFEGQISDERRYVDFEQRGRYIDRALELKGHIRRNGDTNVNIPIMLMHGIPRPQRAQSNGSNGIATGNGHVNGGNGNLGG